MLGKAILPNRHACEQTDNTEFATDIGSFDRQAPAETAPSVRLSVNFQLRQPNSSSGLSCLWQSHCIVLAEHQPFAMDASLATVFMLRAVPNLAAGMRSFEVPILLP